MSELTLFKNKVTKSPCITYTKGVLSKVIIPTVYNSRLLEIEIENEYTFPIHYTMISDLIIKMPKSSDISVKVYVGKECVINCDNNMIIFENIKDYNGVYTIHLFDYVKLFFGGVHGFITCRKQSIVKIKTNSKIKVLAECIQCNPDEHNDYRLIDHHDNCMFLYKSITVKGGVLTNIPQMPIDQIKVLPNKFVKRVKYFNSKTSQEDYFVSSEYFDPTSKPLYILNTRPRFIDEGTFMCNNFTGFIYPENTDKIIIEVADDTTDDDTTIVYFKCFNIL
jgi:hypothetical protein